MTFRMKLKVVSQLLDILFEKNDKFAVNPFKFQNSVIDAVVILIVSKTVHSQCKEL